MAREAWREYLCASLARKVRVVRSSGDAMRFLRFSTVITCSRAGARLYRLATARVADPFVGDWVTAENASITIRPDTTFGINLTASTTLDTTACRGMFRFGRGTKSRQDLTSLVPRQPDLRQKISDILVEQSYPIANSIATEAIRPMSCRMTVNCWRSTAMATSRNRAPGTTLIG